MDCEFFHKRREIGFAGVCKSPCAVEKLIKIDFERYQDLCEDGEGSKKCGAYPPASVIDMIYHPCES